MPVVTGDIDFFLSKSGGGAQGDPNDSIGGAISTTQIVDATLNNLWDDVTGDEAASGDTEYRIIYVKNSSSTNTLRSAVLWISQLTTSTDDEVAIALMAAGKNGTAERLADESTAPSGGESFTSPTTKGTGLSLGDLAAGDTYPIAIRRVVNASASIQDNNTYIIKVEGDTES